VRRFLDYLSVFFGLTTVVGLGLAFYWHGESVRERTPLYHVSLQRTRLVDTSVPAPSQLQVLYRGKDLNRDVNAATLYLWNDGKLPIKTEDVLEPLEIRLEPDSEILDARIIKVSRPVTKFTKGDVADTKKNALPLSFAILEKGDGAALQIIYAGKPNSPISVKGTIMGAGEPQEAIRGKDTRAPKESGREALQDLRRESYKILGLGGLIGLLSATILVFVRKSHRESPYRELKSPMIATLTAGGILAATGVVMTYAVHTINASPVPPSILIQD
jgi:hypothetical protein